MISEDLIVKEEEIVLLRMKVMDLNLAINNLKGNNKSLNDLAIKNKNKIKILKEQIQNLCESRTKVLDKEDKYIQTDSTKELIPELNLDLKNIERYLGDVSKSDISQRDTQPLTRNFTSIDEPLRRLQAKDNATQDLSQRALNSSFSLNNQYYTSNENTKSFDNTSLIDTKEEKISRTRIQLRNEEDNKEKTKLFNEVIAEKYEEGQSKPGTSEKVCAPVSIQNKLREYAIQELLFTQNRFRPRNRTGIKKLIRIVNLKDMH